MSKKTDAELIAEALVIKNETAVGANTKDRVYQMFRDFIDSRTQITNWDMSTNAWPTGGLKGQTYYGIELTTRTTLTDSAGNLLPSKVIAKALIDSPLVNTDFVFMNVIY